MKHTKTVLLLPLLGGAIFAPGCAAQPATQPSAAKAEAAPAAQGEKRKIEIIRPPAPPAHLRNAWPQEWEKEFQARAIQTVEHFADKLQGGRYGNTYFENEKQAYPHAMFDFLAGNRQKAMALLQAEDNKAGDWNKHTEGIDLFPSFTIKGQVRKYFLWGEYLDPEYRKRMLRAARLWTEQDPLRRPHYAFQKAGDGWTPEVKNSWVDVRNTDNLRAMRETSVYLFAEESGNEATRQLYKNRIREFVRGMYRVGIGEWDSENYLGHTFAPYVSLYDFAQDEEVRGMAKAALDWLSAAAAMKYYRGGWAGPTKRDYGGANRVFNSGAARTFDLYFGDTPQPNPDPERDQIHLITSHYRPPAAVVELARKNMAKPVEVLAAKASYDNWSSGGAQLPQYWETMFYGRTFQMGSVVSQGGVSDVGPFKLGAFNSQRGVDFFVANSMPAVGHQGKNAGDQIAQLRNLLIWLRPADKPFYFLLPRAAQWEKENGLWFARMEKTWLALRPINLGDPAEEPILKKGKDEADEAFQGERMFKAATAGSAYAGFALEVGEEPQSYADFKRAVTAKGALDVALLAQGVAKLTGSDGTTLRLDHNKADDLPLAHRNGVAREWAKEATLYKSLPGPAPITQEWGGDNLRVEASGKTFEAKVSPEGKYSFKGS